MDIPVGSGGRYGCAELSRGGLVSAVQRQALQGFPPRLDKVQAGGIGGLKVQNEPLNEPLMAPEPQQYTEGLVSGQAV